MVDKFVTEVCLTQHEMAYTNHAYIFYIVIPGKHTDLPIIRFMLHDNTEHILRNEQLEYPFEDTLIDPLFILNKDTSAIISTMCKGYSHRLEEWIQYNLQLGFSGIVIFNNDGNTVTPLNEPVENCIRTTSMKDICDKYKGKVLLVDCPYPALEGEHWNCLQRATLSIGVNAFRERTKCIALIDADEFMYLPSSPGKRIEDFLGEYSTTITMGSNILTNKSNADIINNNVLQLAKYVAQDAYTKTILYTSCITENEFILTPHRHSTEQKLDKGILIHYHCWINTRCTYLSSMPEIDYFKDFKMQTL
jgi:hypothetical protein